MAKPKKEDKNYHIQWMETDKLLLDSENPRLASGGGGNEQSDLLKILWTEMSVDEVALSIAANGFFPEEALLAIPKDPKEKDEKKRNYIVVEGNRRLAAVMLLTDESLRKAVKATDLPKITQKAKDELKKLPVAIYKSREELWEFLGFRHINGSKPWDAFSKAKFVFDVKENFNVSLDEIARRIGDQHSTVKRFYRGYVVLMQAQQQANFDQQDIIRNKFYFSHLYTAVDQTPFQKFLGIESKNSLKPNPVPKSKLKELEELMTWIYGSKAKKFEPLVKNQSPDLNILREVISDKRAVAHIRAGYPLNQAFEVAIGDERRFQDALTRSKENLMQASATVSLGYKGDDDLYSLMEDIVTIANHLNSAMTKKRQ